MREPSVTMAFDGSNGVSAPTPPPQALLERLKDFGQEDAFALWDELSPEERDLLVKDIEVNFISLPSENENRIISLNFRSVSENFNAKQIFI